MIERLSWASGSDVREGWHHSDERFYEGMRPGWHGSRLITGGPDHVGDIQDGLPWADETFDYVVSHHGLMMLVEAALVPALVELRRVTKPGGWLRVSVPDMHRAIGAFMKDDRGWFPLEASDVDEAFCRYVTQGGATRSVFTVHRLHRLFTGAGWEPWWGTFGVTDSPHPEITELDSRPAESLFMEAVKPA